MEEKFVSLTRQDERNFGGARALSGHGNMVCARDRAAGQFHLRKGSLGSRMMIGSLIGRITRSTRFGVKNAGAILGVLLFLLTSSAIAQSGFSFYGQIVDQTGKPAPFSQLRVCAQTGGGSPCNPLSTLYSDPALTHQISNPFTTDSRGNYTVFVASGYYILQFTVPGSGMYSYTASAKVGTGGANLTPSAIQFAPTSSTTRAATAADVAGLFTGTGPCFLKSDGTCSSSTASAAGTNQQVQVNVSGTFGVDPFFLNNNTTHNTFSRQFNNIPYASQYITSTIVSTVFNEASAGTPLTGTTPATCVSTCVPPWTLASGAGGVYQSGGGVLFTTVGSDEDVIDTGQTDYTLQFNLSAIANGTLAQVPVRYVDATHQAVISICNNQNSCGGTVTTGFAIFDGPSFTLLGAISGTAVGNYTVVLSGNQLTVTGPGGTIGPFTTGNTTGTKVGLRLGSGSSVEFGSLLVSGMGTDGINNYFSTSGPNQITIVDNGAADDLGNVNNQNLPANSIIDNLRSVDGALGISSYNCLANEGPNFGTDIFSIQSCIADYNFLDTSTASGGGPYTKTVSSLSMGPGFNLGFGSIGLPWTVNAGLAAAVARYRPGIADGFSTELDTYADGDGNGIGLAQQMSGGTTAASDQGFTGFAVTGGQFDQRTESTVQSTTGTGDRHPIVSPQPGTHFYDRINSGLEDWLIDFSVGNAGQVTGAVPFIQSPGSGMTPGTYPVTCTGGGGSGATLSVVVPSDGSLVFFPNNITVTNPGSGYTIAPTCTLTGTGGEPATIIAFVAPAGTITGDTKTPVPGSTYLNLMPVTGTALIPVTGDCLTLSSTSVPQTSTPGTYQTDTIQCTVQNSHPITTGLIWMASTAFPERDNVLTVSGGTTTGSVQTLTVQHQNPIFNLQNIYQGGTNGCLSLDANYDALNFFGCYFAFGAYDSTHIIYGQLSHGNMAGNYIAAANNGFMPANPTSGFNGWHIFSGANVLFTEYAIPNAGGVTPGTVGGQPTLSFNDTPWSAGDFIGNPEPTTFDVTAAYLFDLTSNTPADNGDALIAGSINGIHWTANTSAIAIRNIESTSAYQGYGGALTQPNGFALTGAWNTGLSMQFAPTLGSVISVEQNSNLRFTYLAGSLNLVSDAPNNRWDIGGAGLIMTGGLSARSLTYYADPSDSLGGQTFDAGFNGSAVYSNLGDTNGNLSGVLGLEEIDAAVLRAGLLAPTNFFAAAFPTPGSTTYTWVATSVNALGGETLPGTPLVATNGPATLSGSNFYRLVGSTPVGTQFFNVYRRIGFGGTGLICHLTPAQIAVGCNDEGQAGTAAEPTSDTSGNLIVNTSATIQGLNVPVIDTASPTVGQVACIKSAGPPVQIGFCAAGSFTGTACTCN